MNLHGRALHFVFKIGDRVKNIEFFRNILGMKVLRHEEFKEGCDAKCNGPYDGRWSKTMIGYGNEDTHFVLELTYNYNVPSYELGNDFQGISIFSKKAVFNAKKSNFKTEQKEEFTMIESPDGYKFYLYDESPVDKDPVQKISLASSDLQKTIHYWHNILGLKILEQSEKSVVFAFNESQVKLEFLQINEPNKMVDHKSAFGRIAFSIPEIQLEDVNLKVTETKSTILTPLIKLDTPGKATVTVIILADPDGHEICFVGDEGFRELSAFDPNSEKELEKFMKKDLERKQLEKAVLGKRHGILQVLSAKESDTSDIDENFDTEVDLENQEKSAWTDYNNSKLQIPDKLKKYSAGTTESYQDLLRRRFQQTMGIPKWSKVKKIEPESEEKDIEELMKCGKKLRKSLILSKEIIRMNKVANLNKETKLEGPLINSVEFHPTVTVALIAGISGVVSIVQVDGKTNSKLQTVKFKNFNVDCARFTCDGEQFIIGCKSKKYFFYYDLMEGRSVQIPMHHRIGPLNLSKFRMSPDGKFIVICGKFGTMHLLSAKTKEWMGDLKMNSDVVDVSFNCDGSRMYSFGDVGEIFEWDMNSRYCIQKMYDDGCIRGITMNLSPNGQILATGSSSGIVNLYEMPIKEEYMSPIKIIKNLRTPITDVAFNSTSEILAISSHHKHNAVRLVHLIRCFI
ncbi:hypothetical protein PGB90_005925 [Kerria lacca]